MDRHRPPGVRYARRIENNGTWTVFDTFTYQPAEIGSRLTTDMQMSDAEEIMDVLNFIHPANDNGTIHLEEREMDAIQSLSIYRESLISSLWTLDAFPAELREFAAKERQYLERAIKVLEADIRSHRDAEENVDRTLRVNDRTASYPR